MVVFTISSAESSLISPFISNASKTPLISSTSSLLIFPFIVMKKAKVTKEENTDEARKKFNVFLIYMIPVPLLGFIFLLIGLRSFL